MKQLYERFSEIERMMARGYITLKEGNALMIEATEKAWDGYILGDAHEVDQMKAYHRMYAILHRLTKA